jgi:hypothetical protein
MICFIRMNKTQRYPFIKNKKLIYSKKDSISVVCLKGVCELFVFYKK